MSILKKVCVMNLKNEVKMGFPKYNYPQEKHIDSIPRIWEKIIEDGIVVQIRQEEEENESD